MSIKLYVLNPDKDFDKFVIKEGEDFLLKTGTETLREDQFFVFVWREPFGMVLPFTKRQLTTWKAVGQQGQQKMGEPGLYKTSPLSKGALAKLIGSHVRLDKKRR